MVRGSNPLTGSTLLDLLHPSIPSTTTKPARNFPGWARPAWAARSASAAMLRSSRCSWRWASGSLRWPASATSPVTCTTAMLTSAPARSGSGARAAGRGPRPHPAHRPRGQVPARRSPQPPQAPMARRPLALMATRPPGTIPLVPEPRTPRTQLRPGQIAIGGCRTRIGTDREVVFLIHHSGGRGHQESTRKIGMRLETDVDNQ